MVNNICKARSVFDNRWVYGYYVAVPWDNDGQIVHLIIEPQTEYRGSGEFEWMGVHRVKPETVEFINNTKFMEE